MKHLTFDERLQIQGYLVHGLNFPQIAQRLGKDRTTIRREVKNRRHFQPAENGNFCIHRTTCQLPQQCFVTACVKRVRCRTTCGLCRRTCKRFEEELCLKTTRPPYVCNGCKQRGCKLGKWTYCAKQAQQHYEQLLKESREGISLSEEEFLFLDQQVMPLILRGISASVAYDSQSDQMPVSVRTLYTYIDHRVFDLSNLELRRKVRRPLRKKSGPTLKVDKKCYQGRNYQDFQAYMEENPHLPICQMDTVEGKKGGKVLLTLFFPNCNLQLVYLRSRNTSSSVIQRFQWLRSILGDDFSRLFPVLLTDRGTEFTNPQAIEYHSRTGKRLCRVFYCDPMHSNQKSECERNHQFIRYVIPKGSSLDAYEQSHIDLLVNHMNSYPRGKCNGLSPFELFETIYGSSITKKLGIAFVSTETLCLTPDLLKK